MSFKHVSTSSVVLQGLTSLIFVFVSVPFGVISKSVLPLSISNTL